MTNKKLCDIITSLSERQRQSFGGLAQLGEHLPYKQRVTGSSPVPPTIKKPIARAIGFFNDVCLAANDVVSLMMTLTLMMCGFATFYGKHRIIASETSNIIMRSITSYRPGDASLFQSTPPGAFFICKQILYFQ